MRTIHRQCPTSPSSGPATRGPGTAGSRSPQARTGMEDPGRVVAAQAGPMRARVPVRPVGR